MSDPSDTRFDSALPPELLAAPLEFGAWSQEQLLSYQGRSTPTKPLFHYTDLDALKGIISNERLWCFSHLHQSDREEFAYSLAIARRVIKAVGQSHDHVTRYFCECLDDLLGKTPSPTHLSSIFSVLVGIETTGSNGRTMDGRDMASQFVSLRYYFRLLKTA